MTVQEKLDIVTDALESIAAFHLPKADTRRFWANRTVEDCIQVLSQDVDIARLALDTAGLK